MKAKPGRTKPLKTAVPRPYCFVSYSTREAHVALLLDCLRIVLEPHFEVRLTPSALESGASQRAQIVTLIERASFSIVILDGLRPNVVFELGVIEGKGRPVILFKEAEAQVDIDGLYGGPKGEPRAVPAAINLDVQLSDVKDINYATWPRFDLKGTLRIVWQEYSKKKDVIPGFVTILEPSICKR
jgi:hypothetical protein